MHARVGGLLFLICLFTVLAAPLVQAKPSIDFTFHKDNGYGVGDNIGGLWTVTATVSSDVQYVEFFLDGTLVQNDTSAPFSWQFDTSNYSSGPHAIKAVAYDLAGDTAFLQVQRNFEQTSNQTVTIVIVAVAVAIVVAAFGFAVYRVRSRKTDTRTS